MFIRQYLDSLLFYVRWSCWIFTTLGIFILLHRNAAKRYLDKPWIFNCEGGDAINDLGEHLVLMCVVGAELIDVLDILLYVSRCFFLFSRKFSNYYKTPIDHFLEHFLWVLGSFKGIYPENLISRVYFLRHVGCAMTKWWNQIGSHRLTFHNRSPNLKDVVSGGGNSNIWSFTPILREMIQFDEHIFQMGWFNHQLVV